MTVVDSKKRAAAKNCQARCYRQAVRFLICDSLKRPLYCIDYQSLLVSMIRQAS